MKFPPKCRTKKLGMVYTILGIFRSFLNWEGADIHPQIRPRKIFESTLFAMEPSEYKADYWVMLYAFFLCLLIFFKIKFF